MSKKTAKTIIASKNDYSLQVKGNQPNLLKQIKANIAANEPLDFDLTTEKNRGRTENRLVEVFDDISGISPQWVGLQRIVHIHRFGWRHEKGDFDEHHYYILSRPINNAKFIAKGLRGHWGIENRLHYVKDVVQNEDNSNIKGGYAIENLSLLKNSAINIFRLNGFPSIKKARITFANKIKELFEFLYSDDIIKI